MVRRMTRSRPAVLVVGPERGDTRKLAEQLGRHGYEVLTASDTESADNVLERRKVLGLVSELRAARVDGLGLLRRGLAREPGLCVVLLAGAGAVESAVDAMREGAYDVLVPPVHLDRLLAVLERGAGHQALLARVAEMEGQLDERLGLERLTGSSRAIHRVMEQARTVAATRAAVLIEGEPGAGKRLVAQMIHRNSPRKDDRFVSVSCAAAGEGALEGDLFGWERGTTGAGVVRPGRIEIADGGTLFLDDVDATPPGVQLRLLRVVQERAYERVGGAHTLHADVRLIAATSRDLDAEVRAGRFRDDLFGRLSVVRIAVPPLRERTEDIALLVEAFIKEFNREHGRKVTGISAGALESLVRQPWPGNVRELRGAVEGLVVAVDTKRRIELSDVPSALRGKLDRAAALSVAVGMTVAEAERRLIEATLRHTHGDKPRAAAILGIGLRTLYRKLGEYGIR
jgi:two-component system, NtrC family, response regulator AtoC